MTTYLAEYLGYSVLEKPVLSFVVAILKCLLCLLNTKQGVIWGLTHKNTIPILALVLAHDSTINYSRQILKVFTVVALMGQTGHKAVLGALANAAEVFGFPNRFFLILSHFESTPDFMTKGICMSLINAAVNTPKLLKDRTAIRRELNSINFNLLLEETQELILRTALPTNFLCSQIILFEESLMKDERASLLTFCHSTPVRSQRQLIGDLLVEAENHNVVPELVSLFTHMLTLDLNQPREHGKGFYSLIKQVIMQAAQKNSISLFDLLPGRVWNDLLTDLPKENNVLKVRILDRSAEVGAELMLQHDLKNVLKDTLKKRPSAETDLEIDKLLKEPAPVTPLDNILQEKLKEHQANKPQVQRTVPLIQTWTTNLLLSEVDKLVSELILPSNINILGNTSREHAILSKIIQELKINELNTLQHNIQARSKHQDLDTQQPQPETKPTTPVLPSQPGGPRPDFTKGLGKQRLSSRKNEPIKIKILNWTIIPDFQISSTLWSKEGESYLPADLAIDQSKLYKTFSNDQIGAQQPIHLLDRYTHSHLQAFLSGYEIDSHIKRQNICKALNNINEKPFEHNPHPFGQLVECLPFSIHLKCLLQNCLQYDLDNTQFDIPSRFAIALHNQIPDVFEKTTCIQFLINFSSRIIDIKYEMLIVKQAVKALKEEIRLVKLLNLILDVGNMLNSNSPLRDCGGFQLHCLSELSKISGPDGSLLDYIVGLVINQQPDLLDLSGLYYHIKLGAAVNLDTNADNLRSLFVDYNNAVEAAEKIDSQIAQTKLRTIYNELMIWGHNLKETQSEVAEVMSYFGWSSTHPDTGHFFATIEEFLYQVELSREKQKLHTQPLEELPTSGDSRGKTKLKKNRNVQKMESAPVSVDEFFLKAVGNSSKFSLSK